MFLIVINIKFVKYIKPNNCSTTYICKLIFSKSINIKYHCLNSNTTVENKDVSPENTMLYQ